MTLRTLILSAALIQSPDAKMTQAVNDVAAGVTSELAIGQSSAELLRGTF